MSPWEWVSRMLDRKHQAIEPETVLANGERRLAVVHQRAERQIRAIEALKARSVRQQQKALEILGD